MNRWPDGRRLTATDMEKIALDHKLVDAEKLSNVHGDLHYEAMYLSYLSDLTKHVRFEMFGRGELKLDTRTPSNTRNYKETP